MNIEQLYDAYKLTVIVWIMALYAEAGLLEIFKKGMETWEDKRRNAACAALAFLMSFFFTGCVYVGMPHPGNIACFPIWIALFYVVQYFVDVHGGVRALFKMMTTKKEPSEKQPKPKRQKYGKFPVDENGRPII